MSDYPWTPASYARDFAIREEAEADRLEAVRHSDQAREDDELREALARGAEVAGPGITVGPPPRDEFVETMLELFAVVRACCKGYGEPMPHMGMHDASKRLYRMGYRKVAAPELLTCRRCGAENVITAQAVCIDCVGKPSSPPPIDHGGDDPYGLQRESCR